MYPSNTILFKSAWNPKDDDDLSTLSGSTATTLFRSQWKQKHKLDNSSKGGRKSLNAYLAQKRRDEIKDCRKVAQRESRPFDEVEDIDADMHNVPFDEVGRAKKCIDRVNNQDSNDMESINGNNYDDDDESIRSNSNNSVESNCKHWEIQDDGNLEPIMSQETPPRQNRFEKSRQSAFVPTRKQPLMTNVSKGNNARLGRRTRLEKIKQRQGGRLIGTSSRYLNKAKTEPKMKSNPNDSNSSTPANKQSQSVSNTDACPQNPSFSENNITSTKEPMTNSANIDSERRDFDKNLFKLKLKLDAAKSVLGTHSEILSEVSETCKNETLSERGRQNISERTRRLQNSLPPVPSQSSSPSCRSLKTLPNLNSFQTPPKPTPASPGSYFTNSTLTTACTSRTSPSKNTDYIYMTDSVQRLQCPSPKTPDAPTPKKVFGSGELFSPPGLKRRLPSVDNILDDTDEEDENNLPFSMLLHDEDEISCPQTSSVFQEDTNSFESDMIVASNDKASNDKNDKKNHKVKLTVELSGNSLEALEQLIERMSHDMKKYHNDDDSILISTTCDHDFEETEGRIFGQGLSAGTIGRSNYQTSRRPIRLLDASSESIMEEIRTALHEASTTL